MISRLTKNVVITGMILLFIPVSGLLSQVQEQGHDEFLYAKRLFDEGYYDLAVEQLERFIRNFPNRIDIVEAQFLLGQSYLMAGNLDKSRSAFLRIAFVYPESPRAPEALMKVGQVLEIAGKIDETAQAYQRIQAFYPESPDAPEGLRKCVILYLASGDTARSEAVAEKLIESYPHSEAADLARLKIASIAINRDDETKASMLLTRVITNSDVDSLQTAAHFLYATLYKRTWNLDAAEKSYRNILKEFPNTIHSSHARISLADLLNGHGRMRDALKTLEPLKSVMDSTIQTAYHEKSGDAHYLTGKYSTALSHFDEVSTDNPEAALKAAWTMQVSGNLQDAMERFIHLSRGTSSVSSDAKLAAAMLAENAGQGELAVDLWWELVDDTTIIDPYGRRFLELGKTMYKYEYKGVFEVYKKLLSVLPSSPFLDEILYFASLESERSKQYQDAIERYSNLAELYPASPYSDSSAYRIEYIRTCCLKGDMLMERMAELSSRPQDNVNPVRWALDWGDFYLDELKDPVKAIDKYDTVLDDILAAAESRNHALAQSCEAYTRLLQTAMLTGDEFVAGMYSDSAYSRLSQLSESAPGSDEVLRLKQRLILIDSRQDKDDSTGFLPLLETVKSIIHEYDNNRLSLEVITVLLKSSLNSNLDDTLNIQWLNDIVAEMLLQPADDRNYAELQWFQVQQLARSDSTETAIALSRDISTRYRHTPAGAKAAWWLIEFSDLPYDDRLRRLDVYQERYSYLVDPEISGKLKVEFLDTLDIPSESIALREEIRNLSQWGIPRLDILTQPDESMLYIQAMAHYRMDSFNRSEMEFRTLLNLNPSGDNAPGAHFHLALIQYKKGDIESALNSLDALATNHPYSGITIASSRFRIQLYMDQDNYERAREICRNTLSSTSNPDTLFYYGLKAVQCLYRLGSLEEADKEAKLFLKTHKSDKQVEEAKIQFILEKGYLFDRAKRFEDAQDKYDLITRKYPFSVWADDASYAKGLSLVSMGRFAEGADVFEKLIENYSDSDIKHNVMLSLGLARLKTEQYSHAIKMLSKLWNDERAVRFWEPAFDALLTAYRDLRYWDAAIQVTRQFLQRFPRSNETMNRKMDIGQFYLQVGEWDEAVRHYRPLLTVADAEQEAEIQYYIGEAFQHKGEYRTAILEFLKVPILGRKTKLDWGVTALYQAGICYEALDEYRNATRMYGRIIEATGKDSNYARAAQKRIDGLPGE